jgi:hypothetical protein
MLRELRELDRRRSELMAQLAESDVNASEAGTPRARTHSVAVRDLLLNALEDLGCLAFSRELMLYLQARYGREILPARFGTLSKDEQAAFDSHRPRPVFLAHGLTSHRFEAIKRLWGRSDWALWRRIVAPSTGRIQHLQMTAALCKIALSVGEKAASPQMLQILAADHARDLPDVGFRRGQFLLEKWRDVATALLEQQAPADRERREEAAKRFEQQGLPDRSALFGAAEAPAVFGVTALAEDR